MTRWTEPIQKPLNRNVDNFINKFLEKNDFIDLKTQSGKIFDNNLIFELGQIKFINMISFSVKMPTLKGMSAPMRR